jgi:hypothetical protein
LIAHAWRDSEFAVIPEFSLQFTLQAKENMPFAAPVISQVSGRVLDHAYSNASELLSAPVRESPFTFVLGLLDLQPVYNTERNASQLRSLVATLTRNQSLKGRFLTGGRFFQVASFDESEQALTSPT